MPTFTWTSKPIAEFLEYYQEGCPLVAYSDFGFLYYNPLYRYDFTQDIDPVTGTYPLTTTSDCTIDVDNGAVAYEAWHRADRAAVSCYKCDQRITPADFVRLPFINDGSALNYPPTPSIPDPG